MVFFEGRVPFKKARLDWLRTVSRLGKATHRGNSYRLLKKYKPQVNDLTNGGFFSEP
jgi:hypothetical protein